MGIYERNLSKGSLWGDYILILVTLGTHELPFTRLLESVEELKKDFNVTENIVVQSGNTHFKSDVMEVIPFVSYEEMEVLYERASLIICHGGTGSIITGLKKGKKVVAAARLKKYGEHNDDHQKEIIKIFIEAGYLLEWRENDDLAKVIHQLESFKPKPFISQKERLLNLLETFIDSKL